MKDIKPRCLVRHPWGPHVFQSPETMASAAQAYAYYKVYGGHAFQERYGFTPGSVRRYGSHAANPAFSAVFAQHTAALQTTLPHAKPLQCPVVGVGRHQRKEVGRYFEKDFHACIRQHIDTLLSRLELPTLASASFEHSLAGAGRIDCLIKHTDGTLTILEIKSESRQRFRSSNWSIYPVIGQLLFYMDALINQGIEQSAIRLALITDFEVPHLTRALRHLSVPVACLNAAYIMD